MGSDNGARTGLGGFWKDRRVLVTGATGMVGSWLTKALLMKGATVVALLHDTDLEHSPIPPSFWPKIVPMVGALEEAGLVERALNKHEIDTVFHLGAQPIVGAAHRAPLATFEANIRGTYFLLEACRLHRELVQHLVIASSDKAYGEAKTLPYTEDMPLHGRHPYEVSKSCADLLAQAYAHAYNLPLAIARCGNIYGGGDTNWSRIVPGTMRSLLANERPIIRSDGTYRRDYLYVEDVVDAYLLLAEHIGDPRVRGEAFNFSPQSPCTVLELVRLLQQLLHREHLAPIVQNTARGEIQEQYLSSEKARATLQWAPRFTLAEGLKKTLAWYRAYFSRNSDTNPFVMEADTTVQQERVWR